MKINSGIKVFAPATVANLACGFDTIGLALNKPGDEIIAKASSTPGLRIIKITGGKNLPYDIDKNTAGVAAQKVLEAVGDPSIGIEFEIHKKMPFGSGLGSSAASAVAGAMAVNELLRRPFTKWELLPFAMAGEQIASGGYHADNVAPSLLGGITFIRNNASLDVHRVSVPPGLYVTVIYPKVEILTKEARSILKETVSFKDAIQQAGNLGGLIIGLQKGDFELIGRSLEDHIIEPQRAHLIPHFYQIKEAAKKEGALGCSISGSGPSIFAISNNSLIAESIGNKMEQIYDKAKIRSQLFISKINMEGAIKY